MGNLTLDARTQVETSALTQHIRPEYFQSKRWFGSKMRTIEGYRIIDVGFLDVESDTFCLLLVEVTYAGGDPEFYQLPLAFALAADVPATLQEQPEGIAFVVPTPDGDMCAYDAFEDDLFCAALYTGMADNRDFPMRHGTLLFRHLPGQMSELDVHAVKRIRTEQSNTSIIFNGQLILKTFRKLAVGRNPDFEVPHYLTAHTDFSYVPKVAGFIEYVGTHEGAISVGVLQDFVLNQGDGYTNALNRVREYFAQVLPYIDGHPDYTEADQREQAAAFAGTVPDIATRLGQITGQLHAALSGRTELEAFVPERITQEQVELWEENISTMISRVIQGIRGRLDDESPELQALLEPIARNEETFLTMVGGLGALVEEGCHRTRYHGDYHLGQVLHTDADFVILDFEGEPARTLEERRAKHSPLKDVAGMIRSFNYAVYSVLFEIWSERTLDEEEKRELEGWAFAWEGLAQRAFLDGYRETVRNPAGLQSVPVSDGVFEQVVQIFELEKAFYELAYEFNNRPGWVPIPATGILRLIQDEASS